MVIIISDLQWRRSFYRGRRKFATVDYDVVPRRNARRSLRKDLGFSSENRESNEKENPPEKTEKRRSVVLKGVIGNYRGGCSG